MINNGRIKRRYFKLRPLLLLFYYLSEFDSEPRGCIDIDHYREVQCKGSTLILKIPDGDGAESNSNTIIMETQTEENAELWAQSMSYGRFIEIKDKLSAELELRQGLESELVSAEAQACCFCIFTTFLLL